MMRPRSAGVLPYRRAGQRIEILLVLPGGPYWRSRGPGAWQIAKGAIEKGETPEVAARREAQEELGVEVPERLLPLGSVRQKAGKEVEGFAVEMDIDPAHIHSNLFELEWPRRSGRLQSFPEVAEGRWFSTDEAMEQMLESQRPFIARLLEMLSGSSR